MAMLNRGPTPAGEGMRPRVPLLGRGIGGGPSGQGRATAASWEQVEGATLVAGMGSVSLGFRLRVLRSGGWL